MSAYTEGFSDSAWGEYRAAETGISGLPELGV